MGDVGTGHGHDGVTEDEVHGVEVASFEALFGDDRLDFTLGGEFRCIFCEGVVGGDPSAVGECLDGVC